MISWFTMFLSVIEIFHERFFELLIVREKQKVTILSPFLEYKKKWKTNTQNVLIFCQNI